MILCRKPERAGDDAVILEFRVFWPTKEKDLSDAVQRARKQIGGNRHEKELTARGILKERVRKYGFWFRRKEVLIG